MKDKQEELFEEPSKKRRGPVPVEPVSPTPEHLELESQLPTHIRLGTSSWSFPGWENLVYKKKASERKLSRDGLRAYAQHPLLRAVGLDRTHYRPMSAEQFQEHAAQVDDDFRFLVKAHEYCTLLKFPTHPRYGQRRGLDNGLFLDADYAREQVVQPAIEGLGDKLGTLLFQFAPQSTKTLGGPEVFIDRLHAFLRALPELPGQASYSIEIRNREWLTENYRAALKDTKACHCLNALPRMPRLADQWSAAGVSDGRQLIVRWMLNPRHDYASAVESYEPFDALVDEDKATRIEISQLVAHAAEVQQPVMVIVNNKAEGSSPLSVFRLAEQIAAELGGSSAPS